MTENKSKRLNQKGQTTMEYILIIALVVAVVAILGKNIQNLLPQTIQKIFGGVNAKIGQLIQ